MSGDNTMWLKAVVGALGAGAVLGAMGTTKLTHAKNNIVSKVRPKKNRVAVVEVELDEGESIQDVTFLVVKGVPAGTSKHVHEVD